MILATFKRGYDIYDICADGKLIFHKKPYNIFGFSNDINVSIFEISDESAEKLTALKNKKLMTSYGNTWGGREFDITEWVEHVISMYINNNKEFTFEYASDELISLKSYYDSIKNTYADKATNNHYSLYVDMPDRCILPLAIETKSAYGYSDGDHYRWINKQDGSVITDYETFYLAALTQTIDDPEDEIFYLSTSDDTDIEKYLKDMSSDDEIRCKIDRLTAKKG